MRTDTVPEQRTHPTVAVFVDLLLAVVVIAFGLWSARDTTATGLVVVFGTGLAASIARRWTAIALVGVWGVALVQVYADGPVLAATLGVAIVAFRCARYGSRVTTWAAGVSIPVGAVVALVLAFRRPGSVREVAALAGSSKAAASCPGATSPSGLCRCRPHSFLDSCSHHQRPARSSSPTFTARVQGAQPIEGKPRSCRAL